MSIENPRFDQLGLATPLLNVLKDIGYESPSPIQQATIPPILAGSDVVGQAQTGTGKTGAFALPLLTRIDLKLKAPQVLVLAPTRELAIQVAEAFQKYASGMSGFHVLPIYGGQAYPIQLKQLQRGPQVIVGTPGRVMDHMRRGSLKLENLQTLVLDEADEMLKMGFIDDVEWVLEQTPSERQIALFSATMPNAIRRIAEKHLNEPEHITIKVKTTTAETIRQRYWIVQGVNKLDGLTRILETEPVDGVIVFARTRNATTELSEKLQARGYAASPLNGDIAQDQREHTVNRLKQGRLDILVATDVAARGLDVDRVSHVINYDIPHDTESYVHRIGRTGRAGRNGEAILFVAPREKRMLRTIENATRKPIELMQLPSADKVNDQRINQFKQRITDRLVAFSISDDAQLPEPPKADVAAEEAEAIKQARRDYYKNKQARENILFFSRLINEYQQETLAPYDQIATALASLLQGDTPLLIKDAPVRAERHASRGGQFGGDADRSGSRGKSRQGNKRGHTPSEGHRREPEKGMERYRLEVGHKNGVKPGNIVGAIANEADMDSKYIGQIKIHDDYSLVDLPSNMPDEVFQILKKTRVAGQRIDLSLLSERVKAKQFQRRKPGPDKPHRQNKMKGKPKSRKRPPN